MQLGLVAHRTAHDRDSGLDFRVELIERRGHRFTHPPLDPELVAVGHHSETMAHDGVTDYHPA